MLAELGPERGGPPLPEERLHDAVNVIMSYQNHDGGWATYENTRSFHALEARAFSLLSQPSFPQQTVRGGLSAPFRLSRLCARQFAAATIDSCFLWKPAAASLGLASRRIGSL